MQLINASEVISEELRYIVSAVSAVKIYYVWTGRNAWWSTWSTEYSKGCMHTSLESAKKFCEKRRAQGTVFYIDQLPSIAFFASDRILVLSEINTEKLLDRLQIEKLSDITNIIPVSTMTLNQIAYSLNSNSLLWSKNYPKNNSCILSFCDIPEGLEETQVSEQLISYKSNSSGPNYYLSWAERKYDKDPSLLHHVVSMLKSRVIHPNQSFKQDWLKPAP